MCSDALRFRLDCDGYDFLPFSHGDNTGSNPVGAPTIQLRPFVLSKSLKRNDLARLKIPDCAEYCKPSRNKGF
jgi:hypothetical protein